MNFIKTFLAGLLAVVVGTFLVFFLWIFILLGIAGSMEKSVAVHPESILKIDFSEVLTDAPSSDPLAGLDLMTLQTQRQLPLLKALRALEAARDDDRIKGIYLRMNGTGGVTGSAILEELREALVEFKQSGKFVVAYNETYSQGQVLTWTQDHISAVDFEVGVLDDFCINAALNAWDQFSLCYSKDDLEQVRSEREAQRQADSQAQLMENPAQSETSVSPTPEQDSVSSGQTEQDLQLEEHTQD